MKKSLPVFFLLGLMSCSQLPVQNVGMHLPFAPELVAEMQKNVARTPASLQVEEVEGKSARRVYFTALYHQYLTLTHHLNQASEINSCPQFHHDKVDTDSSMIPTVSVVKTSLVGNEVKHFFPETVFNKKFSLQDYHGNIRDEVLTLCEEGVSDNYYKFDNLVTHYAGKSSFHSRPDAMASVLKIPVFANYYFLKMLQAPHALSFVHPEEKRIITLTQTHWFEKYVVEAQRLRNNLLKNRMVKR